MKKNTRDWLLSIIICLILIIIIIFNKDFLLNKYDNFTISKAKEYVRQGDGNIVFEYIGKGEERGHYKALRMHSNCNQVGSVNKILQMKDCSYTEYGFDGLKKLWEVSYSVDEYHFRKSIINPKNFNEHVLLVGGSYTKGANTLNKNTFVYKFKEFNPNAFNYAIAEGFWSPTNILDYFNNVNDIEVFAKNTNGFMYYLFISHHIQRVCPNAELIKFSNGKAIYYEVEDNFLVRKGYFNNQNSKNFLQNYAFDKNLKSCSFLFVKILKEIQKKYLKIGERKFKVIFLPDQDDFYHKEEFDFLKSLLSENDIEYDQIKFDSVDISSYFYKNDPHYKPNGYKEVGKKLIKIHKASYNF